MRLGRLDLIPELLRDQVLRSYLPASRVPVDHVLLDPEVHRHLPVAAAVGGAREHRGGNLRPPRGRRYLPMPSDCAGNRSQSRSRARNLHRHRRLPQPRRARFVLRPGAAQPPVGNLDLLGNGIAPRQQEAEEPAHVLMQLPYPGRGEMGRLLRQVPRAGHVARQGAGAKKAEGHLRGHARQGALRRLVEALRTDWSPPAERPDASMSRFSLTNGIPQLTKL